MSAYDFDRGPGPRGYGRDFSNDLDDWRERGSPFPRSPAYGWARPEFNVSFGAIGSAPPERMEYWGREEFDAPRGWRTGEPRGRGWSAADAMTVGELMTENPEAVTPDAMLAEAAMRMRDLDVGIIPVVSDMQDLRLQGVITDRDIVVRAAASGADMTSERVTDYMSRNVETVLERHTVRDVFTVMKREQVRRVPVTDERGRLVGIVAQADLAVDYAGLNLDRESEVEEVIERISEPARPRRFGGSRAAGGYGEDPRWHPPEYDRDLRDRFRDGWRSLRREARHLLHRDDERGWR